ncbi:MAG TPA: membrane protein insertase YidC [Steroidobacteraceae bacterium]|nr:membrane protein insertase YidC [Steroidobacteraceae bacterium]
MMLAALVLAAAPVDVAVLTVITPDGNRQLLQRHELPQDGRALTTSLLLPPGAALEIAGGAGLVPEELPGFGGIYSNARAVVVTEDGQETLADGGDEPVNARSLAAGDWTGVRGRFWTLLARSAGPLTLDAREDGPDAPVVTLHPGGSAALSLELYAGPVAGNELRAADPALTNMLYAVLWEPLRGLCFGLQWILDRWQDLVGRAWLAILLLSLTVKLLMAPLIMVAERWQADVNRTKSMLEPELAEIRRQYKGEEAHHRTLAVYRKHGVSHFYTFKSLAGFMIQIPIFIAAFDMLGENFRLGGESFLWVADLALPDRAAALPLALPFFGAHLNLLPFVMTAFTVLAARWQEDASLAPALRHGQRLRLYAMAGVFLLLLYTFPAGMVLYWTANNFWHLLRVAWDRWGRRGTAT